ncbi:hypothetical protein MASR1M6_36410 [Rubrivivax sp.]
MARAMEAIARLTGDPARRLHGAGWYTGRDSPNTRRLVADHGGFEYDSDYYGDDLPFWLNVRKSDGSLAPQLVVPYTLDCNDMRFALPQGFSHGEPFFQYLKDAFDLMYAEGDERPAMMSIGMHCRLLGRPGACARCSASSTTCRRMSASGSRAASTSRATGSRCIPSMPPAPSSGSESMAALLTLQELNAATREAFTALLDGTYEHSPWIAAKTWEARPFATLAALEHALATTVREGGREAQLALIRAHPELAGKAMVAKTLTAESTHEQGKAGLTQCTPEEFAHIQQLNAAYNERFGFPFILAVRGPRGEGLSKQQIIADLRAAPCQPPGLRVRRGAAQHPPHRPDSPGRQVRRAAGARQPGLGLGRAPGPPQRAALRRARRAHGDLSQRRAPRRPRSGWRTGCAPTAASTRSRSTPSATSSASITARTATHRG